MQPLREQYSGRYDKNESRPSRYGAFDFMMEDGMSPQSIFSDDVRNKIRNSFGNSVQIPVLDAKDVTIGNVRSCTIADDENNSALITLTFVTYAFGFTMYPGQFKNNDIGYQADFSRKLNDYLIKFAATLDSQAVATFETNKNQYWADLAVYYPQVGDALQVTAAQQNDYYNQLQAIKETQDFYGDIKVVSSTSGSPLVRRLDNQGAGNGVNENFQIAPYDWMWSNRVLNGAGIRSTQYAITEGSTAIETRIDPDSEAGHKVGEQIEWAAVDVPLPGSANSLRMGSLYRQDCVDASGIQTPNTGVAGLTASLKESFQWSVDMVFATAYNSDPANRYSPITKVEISAT